MTKRWQRGSEWRRWDLHVHTPASIHWRGGARFSEMDESERELSVKSIVGKFRSSDVAVWAIQDYWTFDGYIEIREWISKNDADFPKTILPGMELRFQSPSRSGRTDIHVILSDQLSNQALSDFKSRIKLSLTERELSDEALRELSRRVADDKLRLHNFTRSQVESDPGAALAAGSMIATVDLGSLVSAVKSLRGNALLMVPFDTHQGLAEINWRKFPVLVTEVMQNGHIFEVRNQQLIDCFQGRRSVVPAELLKNFIATLGREKPPVSGSDAHRVDEYGDAPSAASGAKRFTWIKCDPTYRGLRSAICESQRRFFVGTTPPEFVRVKLKPRNFIDRVSCRCVGKGDQTQYWFDFDIPLSAGVTAIIGNKGSGKSALADIIGLLGNSRNEAYFSFLSDMKFRSPKNGKADEYEATALWHDGSVSTRLLSARRDESSAERVKYLPQNYLEAVCNEPIPHEGGEFDKELKSVIYSHIPEDQRLGKALLNDIIKERRDAQDAIAKQIRGDIRSLNKEIEALEWEASSTNIAQIKGVLTELERQLDAHDATKPHPPDDGRQTDVEPEALVKLAEIDLLIRDVEKSKGAEREALRRFARQGVEVVRIRSEITALQQAFTNTIDRISQGCSVINVPVQDVVSLVVHPELIDTAEIGLAEQEQSARANLATLEQRERALRDTRARLVERLDEPRRIQQEYLESLARWDVRRREIIGTESEPKTIVFYRKKLMDIDVSIGPRLIALRERRALLSRQLHSVLMETVAMFRTLYGPVQSFIEEQGDEQIPPEFRFSFNVDIEERGFRQTLLSLLDQRRRGISDVIAEISDRLRSKGRRVNFMDGDDVLSFVAEAEVLIKEVASRSRCDLSDCLRKGSRVAAVYDHLYLLEYLNPRYMLTMHGRPLTQLSPGERGALLLVFYLLVDKKPIPIVIDQPEENLDNQTVYKLLGQCIRAARSRRQIVLVTHNPNLAVACDADQVIVARHDKGTQEVTYVAGSLEDPEINRAVLDILEGTQPAFENRDSKYFAGRKVE